MAYLVICLTDHIAYCLIKPHTQCTPCFDQYRRVHTSCRSRETDTTKLISQYEERLNLINVHVRKTAARLLVVILRRYANLRKQNAFSAFKSNSQVRGQKSRMLRSVTRRMLRVKRMICIRLSFSRWRGNYVNRYLFFGCKILLLRLQRLHVRASMNQCWRTWCQHVRNGASRSRSLTTLARRLAREHMASAWSHWVRCLVHANAEKLLQRGRQDAKLQALSLRHNHQQMAERLARIFETKLFTSGANILSRVTYRFCIRNAFCLWKKKIQVNNRFQYAFRKLSRVWERNRRSSVLRRWMTAVHQVRQYFVIG